jgi:hypothetical protein
VLIDVSRDKGREVVRVSSLLVDSSVEMGNAFSLTSQQADCLLAPVTLERKRARRRCWQSICGAAKMVRSSGHSWAGSCRVEVLEILLFKSGSA